MQLRRVVVTGLGAITPIGKDIPSYWDALANGVSGSDLITRFDASAYKTKFACEVKDYKSSDYFTDRKEVKKYDLYTQFAIIAVDQAIMDSKLDMNKLDLDRCGVVWGSGTGGITTFSEELRSYYSGNCVPRFNPFFIPKMILDIAAGLISIKYGLRGPNYATVSACASSTHALIDAFNLIRLGKADLFISGGSEAAICEAGVGGFGAMHALSTNNDNYKTASRPFDKDRDGFVIGEGGGCLILEELEHAKARGAKIYAEMVGSGMSADAYHLTATHPEGDGAFRAMKAAIQDANIEANAIDYINVHGTSTPVGDPCEINAIKKLFGEHAYKLNVSSTKSMTGHLLGAAGAVESIATILAMQNGLVPPTVHHTTPDPELDPNINYTFNTAQKRDIKYALSNTFGFGGHNSCVIFKRDVE